jgi:HK97 family phage major capsid protein
MASNADYSTDRGLYQTKGEVWDQYRGILSQYGDNEEVTAEDKLKLERLNKQFVAIREQFDYREAESEMRSFFEKTDNERRLPMGAAVLDNTPEMMPTKSALQSLPQGWAPAPAQYGGLQYEFDIETPVVIPGATKHLKLKYPRNGRQLEDMAREMTIYNAKLRGGALRQAQVRIPDKWLPFMDGKAALARGSDPTGGFLTPDIYIREFVNKKYLSSFVRNAPTRKFAMSSDVMHIPTIGTASTAAILTSEGSTFNEVEPTFAQVDFTAYKYTRIELASEELVADSEFDLLNEVILPDMAQSFAAAENIAFTTGSGVSQPMGIITGAASTANTVGHATSVDADSLITHYHRLPLPYRQSGSLGWMMHDATIAVVRLIKDTLTQYIWQPGLQAGIPDKLLGQPVYPNNSMATMAANAKSVLFGDLSYYRIGDRLPLAINTLIERYAELGQVAFRGQSRFDGRVMVQEALQVLANSAT